MVYIILMCITCFIYFLFMTLLAVCVCFSLSVLSESATPWTVAHQAPLSKGFSRQEYWSGCHSLLQGIFSTQGSNPGLLHRRQSLYHLSHQGSLLSVII